MGLKVQAIADGDIKYAGYYDLRRRTPNEIFEIENENEFSPLWMKAIGWKPKPMTKVQENAKKEVIKPAAPSAMDIRKELNSRNKTFKAKAEPIVIEVPEEVNVNDTSHNKAEEVI